MNAVVDFFREGVRLLFGTWVPRPQDMPLWIALSSPYSVVLEKRRRATRRLRAALQRRSERLP